MKLVRYCTFFFSVLAGVSAWTQPIRFHHVTTDDGLISRNVRYFFEDYQGFIWLATEDGLQRYDGEEFVTYRHKPGDTTSIPDNFVTLLYEDAYHNFWVATLDGGLTLYNRSENIFRTFSHDPQDERSPSGNRIRAIYESKDGKLFIGFEEGEVDYFDLSEDIFYRDKLHTTKIKFPNVYADASKWVQSIVSIDDNRIYIGSNGSGLFEYDFRTKVCKPILKDTINKFIITLMFDPQNRLWIGTWGQGVFVYEPQTGRLKNHVASTDPHTLTDDHIDVTKLDDQNNVWIATDNGLSIVQHDVDPFEDHIFNNYFHSDLESRSLLTNIVKGLYLDRANRMWVGSYYGGVNVYDRNSQKFVPTVSRSWIKNSLNDNNVFAFAEDSKGNLWVGTDGGGLDYLEGGWKNLHSDQFRHIKINGPITKRVEQKIKAMVIDSEDNLYIGYWRGGLIKYNTKNGQVKQYMPDEISENGPSTDMILDITLDEKENVWLATFSGGLNYFDQTTGKFKHYWQITSNETARDLDKILSVIVDSKNRVWAARSTGGLNLLDKEKDRFITIDEGFIQKDETISHICEDTEGRLWLGTMSRGLKMYNPQTKESLHYTVEDGLPSMKVLSVLQDNEGDLWIATVNGIARFNIKTETFTNYFSYDGLQSNEFNHNSALKCSDGTLLFGGNSGFNEIHPEQVPPIISEPRIVLTKFWLDNRESNINDKDSPLQEHITLTKKINLKYNQNSFSIGFSALNFSFSNKSEFAYKLEGFDDDFKYIQYDNKAIFTNLDPGVYNLHVKAANRTGYWSPSYHMVEVEIHKAFWQTWAFRLGVVLLALFMVYLFYRLRLRFLIRQRKQLLNMVQIRTRELTEKNEELVRQREEIREMNSEIVAQNEELTSQNDQIFAQQAELVVAQEELRKLNANLEKTVADRTVKLESTINHLDKMVIELDRFVYSASHELSAPLRSISGIINITRMEKDNARIAEYLEHVEISVQRMEAVIKSILSYSRNTHMDLELEDIQLQALMSEIIEELRPYTPSTQIEFVNSVDEKIVLNADKQRLKIIIQNIISNAIKYADYNKPKPQIILECEQQGKQFKIKISDNGIGIEKDRLDKVFNMYYRGTTKSQGAGLGLFIVKEMVHRINGQITVQSESGVGTTFEIVLE